MRSLKNAKINLCTWSFSHLKDWFLFKLCLFVCYFSTRIFFAGGARTSNMDKTDIMVFSRSVYLFMLLTNTRLVNYYISVLLNFYLSNEFNKIHCKIYLVKLSIIIPQPHVLGHVFLSFSLKLIKSHKRFRLVTNFS